MFWFSDYSPTKSLLEKVNIVLQETPSTSTKPESNSIRVEHRFHASGGTSECCLPDCTISIQLSQSLKLEQLANGCRTNNILLEGDLIISPPNLHRILRWDKQAEFLFIRLDANFFDCIARELIDVDNYEIIPQFKLRDPLIQQIGFALQSELKSDRFGSSLYAESMANALLVHLLRRYSAGEHTIVEYTDGLSKYKLQSAIDHINDNLAEDLSLKRMSEQVGISQYHFARLFKQSTGFSPYQYVIKTRIERGKQLLLQGKMSISEIALEVGFADHSQFTRHFKRLTGVTPQQIFKQ